MLCEYKYKYGSNAALQCIRGCVVYKHKMILCIVICYYFMYIIMYLFYRPQKTAQQAVLKVSNQQLTHMP